MITTIESGRHLGCEALARRAFVSELRVNSRAASAQRRSQRLEMRLQLRSVLRSRVAEISAGLAQLRSTLRAPRQDGVGVAQVANLHQELRISPASSDVECRLLPVTQHELLPRRNITAGDVLQVVRSHPEGIWIVDLGNELGVDWRMLAGLTRELLEAGEVGRLEQHYFAVEAEP